MRIELVLAASVAACGASSAPTQPSNAPAPVVAPAVAPTSAGSASTRAAVVAGDPHHPVVHAPHTGTITAVAIDPHGGAAISADSQGGVRLWPKLDGTVEPTAVELPVADELALGVRAQGFAVGMIDSGHGLAVARLDRDGRLLSRVSVGGDPGCRQIEMTDAGLLVWRDDQTLTLFDDAGTAIATLPAQPGQRLTGVATGGGRAIAIVELLDNGAVTRRARWVELAPKLAWGAWASQPGAVGDRPALSSDGQLLASIDLVLPAIEIVDTRTSTKRAQLELAGTAGFAFAGPTRLAMFNDAGPPRWFEVPVKPAITTVTAGDRQTTSDPAIAAANGTIVAASGTDLELVTPTKTQFLGYAISSVEGAIPGADGTLLVASGEDLALLDLDLVAKPSSYHPDAPLDVSAILWLAGNDWLISVISQSDGDVVPSIVDLASGSAKRATLPGHGVGFVDYEPATNVLSIATDKSVEIDHFNVAKHELEKVSSLPITLYDPVLTMPVAPELAHGSQLVSAATRDHIKLSWIADRTHPDRASTTVNVDGSFVASDAVGRIYLWRALPDNSYMLDIYDQGKRVGSLPFATPVEVKPDRAGQHIATSGPNGITLYDLDGKQRWTTPLVGARNLVWLSDGALGAVYQTGIARLDSTTGTIAAQRCGWSFGLHDKVSTPVGDVESMCTRGN